MNQAIIEAKKAYVAEIAEKMKNAESTVVVEYRGLTVAEMTELRRELRAEDVEFKVYKNALAQRAVAFGKDATAPARVLAKFAKKHENLVLKSGIVEGKVVDEETIKKLSALPNKEGMISMFLGCLQSPIIKFACAVKAVAESKEGAAEPAAAE